MNKVKIISLGGLGEIGKNMTVFETENDLLIVDCGMAFPSDEQLGVDIVIPDFSYLYDKVDKIRGLVLTHGHEDHIGAIPYLLKKIPSIPIFGTRLTLGIVNHKLQEEEIKAKTTIVKSGSTKKFGKDFSIEFIKVNHSIAGAVALAIKTPAGVIFHTGDFKIDLTPTQGKPIDVTRIVDYGKSGVKLLLCDSTNAEREGNTSSETTVANKLNEIFATHTKNRLIIATFSSNMYRIQNIINSALKYNRKVCFNGRSMMRIIETSMELGYIKIDEKDIVDIKNIKEYPDEKVVIITTGSQGEPMSSLYRMAINCHKDVSLTSNDIVVLSSHTIPGNEKMVNDVINKLIEKNVSIVFDDNTPNIHVSGHACREELKMIHTMLHPQFFMPVHGEARHLFAHKQLAESIGMNSENIIISSIGKVLELTEDSFAEVGEVKAGSTLIDGNGLGDVGSIVIKERQALAANGIIIATIHLDLDIENIVEEPYIVSRGFVYVKESDEIISGIKDAIVDTINDCINYNEKNLKLIKIRIKDAISQYIYEKTELTPMILPIVIVD